MGRTVHSSGQAANGNPTPGVASHSLPGLDVADAAYHTAHSFAGGVPALAQRMAMSQNTLAHKVSLNNNTHHLTLREAVLMQEVTGDARVLQAMAAALGYVCVSVHSERANTTLQQVMAMANEFGQVLGAVNEAVQDGSVTLNEMRHCERQAAELIASLNDVLGAVRAMMPRPLDSISGDVRLG